MVALCLARQKTAVFLENDGFGLARASNTTPVIVLRFEADNPAALERIKSEFRAALQPLKPNAPLPY